MTTLKKIVENLKSMPESTQTEVLDFVEYLKAKENRKSKTSDGEWEEFSLQSAMRGIAEEPSPYELKDIKEKF